MRSLPHRRPEGVVAVLFDRIGPYHAARLRASAQSLPSVGVELVTRDATYWWDLFPTQPRDFERVTLFGEDAGTAPSAGETRRRVARLLHDLDPCAVAVPGWGSAFALAAWHWALAHGRGVVVMSESTAWDAPRSAFRERLKRCLVRSAGAALVGGGPQARYAATLGIPEARVFLGYDAVDNEYFRSNATAVKSKTEIARVELALPSRFFFSSGRFVEKKNFFLLLEAYAAYRELAGEGAWKLVLAGDGPLGPALVARAKELGLSGHVSFAGFLQYAQLPIYYGLASVFVHPATTEQWGLVVNEAMAAGLPVLVSRSCGCAEDLVRDGVNGFVFDPFDVEALARLMYRMSDGSLDLVAMGKQSERIVSGFGPPAFADGLKRSVEVALEVASSRPATHWDRTIVGIASGWVR